MAAARPSPPQPAGEAAGPDDELFRAVADSHRRALLQLLVAGPATVTDLARRLGEARASAAYHAGVLVAAGLAEWRGHWIAATPGRLRVLSHYFDDALLGAARGEARIAVQRSGHGATKSGKKSPRKISEAEEKPVTDPENL